MVVIKKYSNRRLYDTSDSRYITLEELTHKIRAGVDVAVQDAATGVDITQGTLTQIILESRGGARLLPVPLLMQLIRMGDEALAEFFGRYMTWALDIYMRARTQAQALSPYVPLATVPFSAGNALARMVMGASPWSQGGPPPAPQQQHAPQQGQDMPPPPPIESPMPPAPPVAPPSTANMDDVAAIRRELEELKKAMRPAPKKKHAAKNGHAKGRARS